MSEGRGMGMDTARLRHYFVHDLGWGSGHQSRAVFDFLLGAAVFCDGGPILDAGAGHQRYRPFFDDCIYVTQEHQAGVEMKRMEGIEYDLLSPIDERIPLRDDSLHGVLSTSVMEHLRYPERFVAEAFRVLRPGGRIFVNVPFVQPEHETPYDFGRPTRYGLRAWLVDAGFEDVTVEPSSSGTEIACFLLPFVVLKDVLRTDAGLRAAIASSREAGRLLRDSPRFARAVAAWSLARVSARLVSSVSDTRTYSQCLSPVGWLAVGAKPGRLQSTPWVSKAEFLEHNSA